MNDVERYAAAAHAMQSGVKMTMELDGRQNPYHAGWQEPETSPKHLRVGVNAALTDAGGLVELLIEKGVFTREEYLKAIADAMERERDDYAEKLKARLGVPVTLA